MSVRVPFFAAVVLTLLNALKPAAIDDTAYLTFARHLAEHPLDPYGWELFWYSAPQPAMEILLPPVLPYWLAAGIALFGENLFVLKLWLLPFAWLLCASVASLLARFGAGADRTIFIVFAGSPAVLPLFGVMLDIPALALGAASIAAFIRGCDRRTPAWCFAAGLLAGLAMQTKYSMLVAPAVLTLYAFVGTSRRAGLLGLLGAALAAFAVFAGWELFLLRACGESHFLHHFRAASEEEGGVLRKFAFAKPLLIQFGGLACGLSLVAGRAAGWPVWVRIAGGAFAAALLIAIAALPNRATQFGTLDLSYAGFFALGIAAAFTFGLLATRMLVEKGLSRDTLFLLLWAAIEILGMLGMTPFPAARRLVGVHLVAAVFVAHAGSRLKIAPDRWAIALALGIGAFVAAVDCWDAYPEKVIADRAATVVDRSAGETVWYTGHWGFQYYAERHGMTPIIPYRSEFRAGDWLVVPEMPQDDGFYRPNPPDPEWPKEGMSVLRVTTLTWDDGLYAQTIPNLYGGAIPVTNRDHPRLKVAVYRVLADWRP